MCFRKWGAAQFGLSIIFSARWRLSERTNLGEEINPPPETERLRFIDRYETGPNRKDLWPKDCWRNMYDPPPDCFGTPPYSAVSLQRFVSHTLNHQKLPAAKASSIALFRPPASVKTNL